MSICRKRHEIRHFHTPMKHNRYFSVWHTALFAVVAVSAIAALAGAACGPRFEKAVPVWPRGYESEWNTFFGFRATVVAHKGERPLLRVTGCSDYRISLNGRHVGWGPARAAKGWFRVDEISLDAEDGTNVVAIEAAGYNCNSFCLMDQPPFLQAEIALGGRIVAATGAGGGKAILST